MAGFYCTGPVLAYALKPGAQTALFLGTCETTPELEVTPHFAEAVNDFYGRSVAAQKTWDNCSGSVKLMLSRYSQTVLDGILAQPNTSFANPTGLPGTWTRLAVGSLTYGISSYQLLLVNAFAVTVGGVAPNLAAMGIPSDMPAGTRFINAQAVKVMTTGGTEVGKAGVIFEVLPLFNPSGTQDAYGTPPFGMKLFDYDMTAVPREDPS